MKRKNEEPWNLPKRWRVIAKCRCLNLLSWFRHRILKPLIPTLLTGTYLLGITAVGLAIACFGEGGELVGELAKDVSGLFSTVGAMIAGMLAIVFTLRVLLIQNAASTQSAGFFEIMAHDKWQERSYWALAIISLLDIVIAGVLHGAPNRVSLMTASDAMGLLIITTGLSLYLVFFQLSRIHKRINPLRSIIYVKASILEHLTEIGAAAVTNANYMRAKGSDDDSSTDSKRLAASFLILRPQLTNVFARLTFLFDYHDKLYQRCEKTAARMVLRTIGEVGVKYLEIRRDSFFLTQSAEPFVPNSDSQVFFRDLLEQLVAKAKRYILSDDDDGVTDTIRVLETMSAKAMNEGFIGETHGENPIVEQCRFHLALIVRYAGQHQHLEGLFQGVKSFGRLGRLAAGAGLRQEAQSVSMELHMASLAGVSMRQDVIWTEAIASYCKLLAAYGTNPPGRDTVPLSFIFDSLRLTLNATFKALGSTLTGASSNVYRAFATPFETATYVVHSLMEKVSGGDDQQTFSHSLVIETCKKYRCLAVGRCKIC